MAKHTFLSDEWFDAVETLVDEQPPDTSGPHSDIVVNLIVTGAPSGDCEFHMGSKDGAGGFGRSHQESADVTLTTDYDTAKEVFVSGNPQAGMQAFMAGKVKVQGDMTKLMAAQAGGGTGSPELQQQIQDVTE